MMAEISEAPAGATPVRLLLVDDDRVLLRVLSRILSRRCFLVRAATSAREALDLLARDPFDAVLTDLHMPGESGLEVARAVAALDPTLPIWIMTATPQTELGRAARSLVGSRLLAKPFDIAPFAGQVEAIVALRRRARAA